ncbi:MAG TPA: ABC transporter permease [Terriglobia bacterium]|nr:ABC transporter permease [Terriglobia bacterium]
MSLLRHLAGGLRALFRKQRAEREMEEELRGYLDAAAKDKMRSGMSPDDALRAARVEMGSVEAVKEEIRDAGWESALEAFWQDLRYAFRQLRQSPQFTAVCVLTLALGIGANTAIFTLVDAVMLRSLPVAKPGELYRLGDNNNCCVMTGTQNDGSFVLYSYPLYEDLRDHTPEFSQLAAFKSYLSDLSVRRTGVSSPAEPYKGEFVSGNYFAALGVGAFAGRMLTSGDDKPGAPPTAVMNYHTWQTHFGGDPSMIGSTFNIDRVPYTIVGVTPPQFYGDTLRSDPPDFWLPLAADPNRWLFSAEFEWLYLIGRLKPEVAPAMAQAHLTGELQRWLWSIGYEEATPEQRNDKVMVEKARQEIARQHIHLTPAPGGVDQMQTDYAAGLRLLVTIAGLVLLIACANVANLLLARGAAHRLQTAVRLALGATRARLLRQRLTESILLAVMGGAAGLYVAYAGTRTILLLAFRGAHYIPISPRPSVPVLGFAFLLSLITGVVFGVAPAWIGSRSDPADALRGAGRSTGDRSSLVQKPLVVVQVAFSTVLLIGAGLVTQSLRNLEDQHFGFVTDGRLIVNIAPELAGYSPNQLPALYQRLEEALPRIPGVLSASLSWYSPLGGNNSSDRVFIEGKQPDDRGTAPSWDRVGPHYFETIGTRLLRGRAIEERDTPAAQHVAVVNETFARRFFPHEDPIGQHFGMGDASHSGDYEIVGIVEDAKYQDTRGPAYATSFLPLLQAPPGEPVRGWVGALELHVAGKPENFEPAVRKTLAGVDPNLTVLSMMSFGEQVARNFNQERLIARLTELLGALGLVLACVGLYGVTAYTVARRTGEIGVRMALGADRASVLGLVLRGALAQVALGLAIGIPVALAGGRLLATELYGVKSYDPFILGFAAVVLTICGLAAGLLPARRAASIDPIRALRTE